MNHKNKTFALGLFILAALVALFWLVLLLKPNIGDSGQIIHVRFANVDKITKGTQVTFAGKPVGEVKEIQEISEAREHPGPKGELYFYDLTLDISPKVKLYSYDEITSSSAGLLGQRIVSIVPKPTPSGRVTAQRVGKETMYAQSKDPMNELFGKLGNVSDKMNETMQRLNNFFKDNSEEMHSTFVSLHGAAEELKDFFNQVNDSHLAQTLNATAHDACNALQALEAVCGEIIDTEIVPRTSLLVSNLEQVSSSVTSGKGTLGKLLYDNTLYCQGLKMFHHLDTLINDINDYGLLFQWDKKWQRVRRCREIQKQSAQMPENYINYFDQELRAITHRVGKISTSLDRLDSSDASCLTHELAGLLAKVEALQQQLKEALCHK